MKKKRREQDLMRKIDRQMDLNFQFSDISDRIDTQQYAKPRAVVYPRHTYLRPATAMLAICLMLVTAMVGAGGWMIANRAEPPLPPVEGTHGSDTGESSVTQPSQGETSSEGTVQPTDAVSLYWQGEVYERTEVTVDHRLIEGCLGQIILMEGEADTTTHGGMIIGENLPDRLAGGKYFFCIDGYASDAYIAVQEDDQFILYKVAEAELPVELES